MMVERYPNLKEEVGGLILGFKISYLLDKTCALVLACRPFVSKIENIKKCIFGGCVKLRESFYSQVII